MSRHQTIEEDLKLMHGVAGQYMGCKDIADALTEMARLRCIESAWEKLISDHDHHMRWSTSSEGYRHGMCESIEAIFDSMKNNPPQVFTDDDF